MNLFLAVVVALVLPAQRVPTVAIGSTAPGFTATDDGGVQRSLADYRGKFVVLEWHEKGCPYVSKHYKTGHMQRLQKEWIDRGVVWLLINSSTEGFHSSLTPEESRAYRAQVGLAPTAMILDAKGVVGRLYGATTALHMVIIDPAGKTVYNGAIDDKPVPEASSLVTAKNFVGQALAELFAKQPVSVPTSVPYGCEIHYGAGPFLRMMEPATTDIQTTQP